MLDLLLFITNGLNDKLLWNDNSASFNERLSAVLHAIKACVSGLYRNLNAFLVDIFFFLDQAGQF